MNIIITGTSRGIGRETAKILAEEKENKIIVISRSRKKLLSLKNECDKKVPGNIIPFMADIENFDEIKNNLFNFIEEKFTKVDILINNAGYLKKSLFKDIDSEQVEKTFNINFFSPSRLIKLLLPFMGKEERSHVINISSMGAFQGSAKFPGLSYYSASKAAIANLTECLAEECKKENVSFNCLALGSADTEMFREAFPGFRAAVSAREMAYFIADFAKNGHNYFNGKILPVSGNTP